MTDYTDHRAEAKSLLADANDWAAVAGELSPESNELACIGYAAVHALLAIHDTLTAAVAAADEPEMSEAAEWLSRGGADPLDEDDHRDRIDRHGDIWQRVHEGCWMEPAFPPVSHGPAECLQLAALPGPLTFAYDSKCSRCGDTYPSTAEDAMEHHRACTGETPENPLKLLLCPECDHHINGHGTKGCWHFRCDCPRTPEDVAHALIDLAVKAAREADTDG